MKSHSWVKHHHQGDRIEVTVRSASNARIESWLIDGTDRKRQKQVLNIVKKKYGIDLFFKREELDKDLEWLG